MEPLLAIQFPQLSFAKDADEWLESIKTKTIQRQLEERHIKQIGTLQMLCTAGLGVDEKDGFRIFFNDTCKLELGFASLGHEIGHTFHFDLTKNPPVTTIDQESRDLMYDFDKDGEPNGFYIEDFCDAFSLRWMAINKKAKVKKDCDSDDSILAAFILMLSRASSRVINP